MHPAFSEARLHETRRELERKVRDAERRRRPAPEPPAEPVLLRLSRVQDDVELDRLAQLNGFGAALDVRHVVAEVGGEVVAALPIPSGQALADPFRPTAHLVPLLELRADQLAERRERRRRGLAAAWSLVRGAA